MTAQSEDRKIYVSTSQGPLKCWKYKCRAVNFVPTSGFGENSRCRRVSHVPTGMAATNYIPPRLAEILSVVFDKLFSGRSLEEMSREYAALPPVVRRWCLMWKAGAHATLETHDLESADKVALERGLGGYR